MIVVVARYRAREDTADLVAQALREYTPKTRAEPGCVVFVANRSREDRREFLLYEQYSDGDAFDAHCSSAHYTAIARDRIRPLLEHREVAFFDALEPSRPKGDRGSE